jgi:hypothetical protein
MVSQAWIGAFGAKESTREELAGGGGSVGWTQCLFPSFTPGHPGLPFPPLSLPELSPGDGTKRETPAGGRVVEAEMEPHFQDCCHLPERPHWHRVDGQRQAGAAPGAHWIAGCGKWRFSLDPVSPTLPTFLSYTDLRPLNLSSCRPTLGVIRAVCISSCQRQPLQLPLC